MGLAPSFGTLTSTSVKALDDNLKVMIAGTMRALAQVPVQQRSWEKIVSVMMQNPLIEPDAASIYHADKLLKEETNFFKVDGSPDQDVVKGVHRAHSLILLDVALIVLGRDLVY
jgi:fructose-1,6-bisphosphatase/sedoheptulose 1,7-bisphosphatase-like protein